MRIRRHRHPSKEITGAFCATCRMVCAVEHVNTHTEMTVIFTLTCGHIVTLTPGTLCGLDVQDDRTILYLNRADLPVRQEATS